MVHRLDASIQHVPIVWAIAVNVAPKHDTGPRYLARNRLYHHRAHGCRHARYDVRAFIPEAPPCVPYPVMLPIDGREPGCLFPKFRDFIREDSRRFRFLLYQRLDFREALPSIPATA